MTGNLANPLTSIAATGLILVVMLLCGPGLLLRSTSRHGGVNWPQVAVGLAGTALWIVILSAVISHV